MKALFINLFISLFSVIQGQDDSCGLPVRIPNGRFDDPPAAQQFGYTGDRIFYRCSLGFTFNTSANFSQCRQNGQWSPIPVCVSLRSKIKCNSTDSPKTENGYIFFRSYSRDLPTASFGDFVKYSCITPYNMTHDSGSDIDYSLCGEDGKWTRPPNCSITSNETVVINVPVPTYVVGAGAVAGAQRNEGAVAAAAVDDCSDWLIWAIIMTILAAIFLILLIIFIILFCCCPRNRSKSTTEEEIIEASSSKTQKVSKSQVEPKPTPASPIAPAAPIPIVISAPKKVATKEATVNTDHTGPIVVDPPKIVEKVVTVAPPAVTPQTDKSMATVGTMTTTAPKTLIGCQTESVRIVDDEWLARYKAQIIAEWTDEWQRRQRSVTETQEFEELEEHFEKQADEAEQVVFKPPRKARQQNDTEKLYYARRSPIVSVLYHRPDPVRGRALKGVEAGPEVFGGRRRSSSLTRPARLSIVSIKSSDDMRYRKRWVIDQAAVSESRYNESDRRRKVGLESETDPRHDKARSSELDWVDIWKGTY